jgi:hypothetical protein
VVDESEIDRGKDDHCYANQASELSSVTDKNEPGENRGEYEEVN